MPCSAKNNTTSATAGVWTSECELSSPQITSNGLLSPIIAANGEASFMTRRYCVPLRCGVFKHWDDEKLIPILNFGGLRIELILEAPQLALQRICGTSLAVGAGALANLDISGVVGGGGYDTKASALTNDKLITLNGIPGTVEATGREKSGFAVGNRIIHTFKLAGAGADQVEARKITAITFTGADMVITVDGADFPARDAGNVFLDLGATNGGGTWAGSQAVQPSYKVMGTEMRLCVVAPTAAQATALTSAINYEFTTYDLFLDNVATSTLRHQVPIHSVASKARCIMSMLYDVTTEKHVTSQNYYAGLQDGGAGQHNVSYNNEVVFFINNKSS